MCVQMEMPFAKIIIGDSRRMVEVGDEEVDLVVTSPPYWHIKDYGVSRQIGYGQSLHEYLKDLYVVWKECFRVLKPGGRMCVNIGDQFLKSTEYGRYKIAPIHAEVIIQGERIGFDYMGSIVWQKKTTMNTTGGANVMGSYPYPPNGLVEVDYEFILIFKKPGKKVVTSKEIKERSKLTKEEWKKYFSGHWSFPGKRQLEHEAVFPEELPKRLIRMFSFVGDVILDPFLGSGTTIKVALNLGRNAIGYEINEKFLPIIERKVGLLQGRLYERIEVIKRREPVVVESCEYSPSIKDARPMIGSKRRGLETERFFRVKRVLDACTIELDSGLKVRLCGVNVVEEDRAKEYLERFVKGRRVFLRFEPDLVADGDLVHAYVFLKNRIFVNREMVRLGMADASRSEVISRRSTRDSGGPESKRSKR